MLPGGETVLFTVHDKGRFHVAAETLSTKSGRSWSSLPTTRATCHPVTWSSLAIKRSWLRHSICGRSSSHESGGDRARRRRQRNDQRKGTSDAERHARVSARDCDEWSNVDVGGSLGSRDRIALPARQYNSPAISPDGRQIAFSIDDAEKRDVYIYDLATGSEVRFTRGGNNQTPIWSRDGKYLTYTTASRSDPLGRTLVREPVDQNGPARGVGVGRHRTRARRMDGRRACCSSDGGTLPEGTRMHVVVVSGRTGTLEPGRRAGRGASTGLSPDGRWLAFTSYRNWAQEVSSSHDRASKPRQLSFDGGRLPKWSRDGREAISHPRQDDGCGDRSGERSRRRQAAR